MNRFKIEPTTIGQVQTSKKLLSTLASLTLGFKGMMLYYLQDSSSADKQIFLAKEGETIVGWLLKFPHPESPREVDHIVHIFVKETHRRLGVASLLCQEANKPVTRWRVFPENKGAYAFFKSLNQIQNEVIYEENQK